MDDSVILSLFQPLWTDAKTEDEEFLRRRPLLAHYTSLDALEKILKSDEVWFSNPLFMNDLEEVRFGVMHGVSRIKQNDSVRSALKTNARQSYFSEALDYYVRHFEEKYLLDTYVFCCSEHNDKSNDGVLSMWRGYGENGKGAALVFDTSKLAIVESAPIVISRVHYGSIDARFDWIDEKAETLAQILFDNPIVDEKLYIASHAIFERIKLFALFSKHHGFSEEQEWRAVYMSERDTDGKLKSMLHYLNGPRGVEPKLRFPIAPLEGLNSADFSFDKILAAILLGPSTSSALAVQSVKRMLDVIGKSELSDRVFASTIPLRYSDTPF